MLSCLFNGKFFILSKGTINQRNLKPNQPTSIFLYNSLYFQKEKFITAGNYVVIEILKWDEENNLVYFMGTEPDEPGTRHLYQGRLDDYTPSYSTLTNTYL